MILTIDATACTRCGLCAQECPSGAARSLPDGSYAIHEPRCIHCGHCAAVCPADAVRSDLGPFLPWEPPGIEPERVAALLRGKRSARRYAARPIEPAVLDELLLTGSLASTASNAQDCTATVLSGAALAKCREGVAGLYAGVARLLRNPFVRFLLRFTEARRYVTNPDTMEEFDRMVHDQEGGRDRLFFGAPVVLVLSAPERNKRFGRSNCVLAGEHMMLHAESLGIGSCMVGFAETAMNIRKRLRRGLGIPAGHRINLVFTLGYSVARYHRLPQRKGLAAGPQQGPAG